VPLLENVPPVVRSPVCALIFYWLAAALGRRLCRFIKLRREPWSLPERGALYAALGTGLLQYLPFGLALFSKLSSASLRISLIGLGLLLSFDLAAVAKALWNELRAIQFRRISSGWKVWGSMLGLVLLFLLVHALAPGRLADDDGYHLTAPKRWLEAGALVYLPSYGHTNSPMGFEMLYAIALAVGDVTTAKMLHFGAGCLTIYTLALCGRRLSGWIAGLYAVTLLILPVRLYDFTFPFNQAYIELGTCFMVAASVLALSVWYQHEDERALWLSALCAGFASSFKFPALFIGFGLLLAAFTTLRARQEPMAKQLRIALGVGILSVLPVLPWLARNFWLTGNPVYPMFPGLIPSRDWNAQLSREFGRYFRYYNWLQNTRSLGETPRKILLLIAAVVLVGAAVFAYRRTRDGLSRSLIVFAAVPLLAWLPVVGLYFRFWLPVIMVVWLLVAAFLQRHVADRPWVALPPIAGLGLWLLSSVHALSKDDSGFRADLRVGFGLSTPEQEFANDELWQAFGYLNRDTPKSAHVLFAAFSTTFGPTSAGGSYWVDRACFATDARLQGYIRSREWSEFVADIKKAHIDYVLISAKEPTMDFTRGLRTGSENEFVYSRRLVEQYGRELRRFGNARVFELSL